MRATGLLTILLALNGCGLMMHGPRQTVGIATSPAGALVMIDGKDYGVTPLSAKLRRKVKHLVELRLEGYVPHEVILQGKISKWIWGSIILGGVIGVGIDVFSGGLNCLTPESVVVNLQVDKVSRAHEVPKEPK